MQLNPPAPRTASHRDTISTDGEHLASTRVKFLTSEAVELGEVRDAILASWWRSRQSQVAADHIEVPYVPDQNTDAEWVRSARPVLDHLGEQLDGQPISLILTDNSGVVVSQYTGDPDLHRHLESVDLVPGFSYGERFVGTNGIGTAIEDGRPMHVFGHEHYAEHLENLACAGVPLKHPISGRTIGAVDLTCWRKDAGGLLIALARSTAEQIQHALLTSTSVHELELFQAYLQACRRTGGIVMALNDDVVMMNDYARQLLQPGDQSVLLGRAKQEFVGTNVSALTMTLPSGTRVRMRFRRMVTASDGSRAGGVLHVEVIDNDGPGRGRRHEPMVPTFVPGLVGSTPLWLRCCHEVDASCAWGEWVALVGEPGTGKSVLAQRVYQLHRRTGRVRSRDADDAETTAWLTSETAEDPPDALIIRHVDRLDAEHAAELAAALRAIHEDDRMPPPWIAVTLTPDAETRTDLADLLALFPRTVQVPPLRYRIEDVRQLVPFFLGKLSRGGRLSCSPQAMQLLMRSEWADNVAGLYHVLSHVTKHRRRTGEIQPGDLPAEHHTVARRALNRLESMERDAIVQSLDDAHGNKARAAGFLGMSRATIYRKIHDYGIVTPSRSD